jgi:hypothetical protein
MVVDLGEKCVLQHSVEVELVEDSVVSDEGSSGDQHLKSTRPGHTHTHKYDVLQV